MDLRLRYKLKYMVDTVHLMVNRLNRKSNIYLLFIPSMFFVVILILLLVSLSTNKSSEQVATTDEPSILGEEVER